MRMSEVRAVPLGTVAVCIVQNVRYIEHLRMRHRDRHILATEPGSSTKFVGVSVIEQK